MLQANELKSVSSARRFAECNCDDKSRHSKCFPVDSLDLSADNSKSGVSVNTFSSILNSRVEFLLQISCAAKKKLALAFRFRQRKKPTSFL